MKNNSFPSDIILHLALRKINGLGTKTHRSLVTHFGDIQKVLSADVKDINKCVRNHTISKEICEIDKYYELAKKEWDICLKNDIQIIPFTDSKYPDRLNQLNDSPSILFYKGNADLNALKIVSIVGTRKPTSRGIAKTQQIVKSLKQYNCTIISGLAYGVDYAAHAASIKYEVPTIGVLGHGLHDVYPPSNRNMAQKMLTNGGLLTEFDFYTKVVREQFPMRNKIVAGLSDLVIVVESGIKGGSLITAKYANAFNKDVFAVPGRTEDELSQGCNMLIKSHQAHMYESVDDIEYIMRWNKSNSLVQGELFQSLTEDEKLVISYIRSEGAAHIDNIQRNCKLSSSTLASIILNLELKDIIKSIAGKRYNLV